MLVKLSPSSQRRGGVSETFSSPPLWWLGTLQPNGGGAGEEPISGAAVEGAAPWSARALGTLGPLTAVLPVPL